MTDAASAASAGTDQGAGNTASNTNTSTATTTNSAANENWYPADTAPDDIKYMESKAWTGKDAPVKIFKSYQNAEKLISQIKGDPDRIIVMPKDMTNKEEVAAYRSKMGIPNDPKEYEIEGDTEFMNEFRNMAFEKGMSKDNAKAVLDWAKTVAERAPEMEAQKFLQESETQLNDFKKETGAKYDEKIQAGKTAFAMFPSLKENAGAMEKSMGTKAFLGLMADIGSKLGEATAAGATQNSSSGGMSAESAKQAIQQMQADRNKVADLMDSGRPGYQATKSEWDRLHKIAYPG
jgi:hypothetical protein